MALGLTLDSEVVSLLADGDHRAAAVVKAARNAGALVHLPAAVLAESTTGDPARDAKINRIIKRLQIADADEPVGRTAGRLRYEPHGRTRPSTPWWSRRPPSAVAVASSRWIQCVPGGSVTL